MEILSEHNCQGWLEGYLLTGRHGLFASYEAFAMVSASMTVQHAKWLEAARDLTWRAPVASLNVLLTSTCWRNDHNGFSHQGPGLIDTVLSKKGTVSRIYLPPDANSLLVGRRPLPPQPRLREPDRDRQAAAAAVARHGRRPAARRARRVGVGLGGERAPEGARRGARLGRRHRDHGDARRRPPPAPALPRARVPRRERRRPHGAVPRGASPARHGRGRVRRRCSPPTPTSCSPSTATRVRSTI